MPTRATQEARTSRADGRAQPLRSPVKSPRVIYRPQARVGVLEIRIAGGVLIAIAGYGAIAVVASDGAIADVARSPLIEALGWLALPWCVACMASGGAMVAGPIAWRRTVLTRLTGVAILLAGFTVATAPREPVQATEHILGAATGSGVIGGALHGAVQSVFGSNGATIVSMLATLTGAVLLAGIPRPWWRQLGQWATLGAIWAATKGAHLAVRGGSVGARAVGKAVVQVAVRTGTASVAIVIVSGRLVRHLWQTFTTARPTRAPSGETADAWHDGHSTAITETAPLRVRRPVDNPPRPVSSRVREGSAQPQTAASAPPADEMRAVRAIRGDPHREPTVPQSGSLSRPDAFATWHLPSVTMLSESAAQQLGDAEIAEKASTIERTLRSFNIPVTVREARVGPTVTQFSLVPGEGVPVKAIKRFEYDLQLRLMAKTLRIELPVPGRPFVGIEIPNDRAASVGLREILESREFSDHTGRLRVGLGRDVDGRPRVGDLARMPHVLIAGQTGAGKSVCLNTIVASLLCFCRPDELNLLMIDPKQVELAEYEGIPHLRYPVVTDLAEAGKLLLWVCDEMERRYTLLSQAGYRHLDAYNRSLEAAGASVSTVSAQKVREGNSAPQSLPYIVLIIDELADLMMFAPDDVEPAICRLTAKARAVGIHLVVATQRPSVNVVTGLIKANIPSRVAFAVASQTDSRVILDTGGAEALLGKGDMLYLPYDQGRPVRVQGAWVSDGELSALVKHWKAQGSPNYVSKAEIDSLALRDEEAAAVKDHAKSALVDRALEAMRSTNSVSVSFLQRKLGIGYPKAAKLMDDLEDAGHVELDETTGRTYRVIDRGGAPDDAEDVVKPVVIGRRGRIGRR